MASTKTKMEIPAGDTEAPEQYQEPQEATSQKEGAQDSSSAQGTKHLILAGVLVLLTLTAILVGVLPDWKKDDEGKEESLNQSDSSVKGATFLELTDGPFNVTLPLFSQSITEGYSSEEEVKDDLKELAKFFLNDAIASNNGYNDAHRFPEDELAMEDGDVAMEAGDMAMDAPLMSPTSPQIGAPESGGGTEEASDTTESLEGVDAYETNNQEFTIDRADFVKSDGNLLFAAYQDYLIVFAAEGGDIIAEVQMTPLEVTGYGNGGPIVEPFFPEPEPEPIEEEEEAVDGERPEPDVEEVTATARSSIPWGWNPKPRIEAILIHENRLTLAVSGYGMEYIEKLGRTPYLYEYLGTRIQVYDINGGDLQLLAETDVNGSFLNAYSNGEAAYVVTRSTINTWDHLVAPAQWYPGMDKVQYEEQVARLVDDGLVDTFVNGLVDELQVNGPIDLARLSLFTDSIADDNSDRDLYSGLLAQSISQVVSLDMTSVSTSMQEIEPQITGTFHPGSWGQVYAMGSMIIVADVNWSWIREENRSAEKTFLICFRLDGASSSHSLVGSVNGSLLNPFSLDYVDKPDGSYVRVATTQSFWSPWIGIMEEDVMVAVDVDEQAAQDVVLPPDDESSTLNQIIVLKVPSDLSGTLEVVGSVELGEPNERFTSVRFFDDFAYAVTFERTDPFYVVDLSAAQPRTVGELKVPGFSEYLHPIDSEDKFLVAIGQDADEEGFVLGFQISLFDASVASEPKLVDRLPVENEKNSWSSSSASWDERAFRFLSLGDRKGKVIVPLSIYTYQEFDEVTGQRLDRPIDKNFEGFSVFNIEDGKITKDFDIDHSFEAQCTNGLWYDWLPERSFVFDGNVVTMKKHVIMSTSLSTGETVWTLPINESSAGDCQFP